MDQRRPDHDDPEDDPSERARCALLDGYWEDLQRQSSPDPQCWLSDRDSPDQTIAGELDVLSLLHELHRVSRASGDASQAQTIWVSEPFDMGPEPQRSDPGRQQGRAGDRDGLGGRVSSDTEVRAGGAGSGVRASPSAAMGPEAAAEPPRRVGKYLVVELLDEGGQAQVFRVLHPELGKEFVLKLDRRPIERGNEAPTEPAGRDWLLREGRLLAQCDHPNLVRVVDLDVHEGHPFMVMEHVPGLTLQQFTDQHRPGPRQSAQLVAELARVVAYLHARGIIHQDIKPRNVLVDEQGRPRLIDFGLARLRHAWFEDTTQWTGGTALYMSPEQALGRADQVGPRTDVFGLGGLLYHLLTGQPLYQGASRASVRWQAMKAAYIPVRQLNRRAPRSLERICHKALALDPDRRYPTAVELGRDLRQFLARRWIAAAGLAVVSLVAIALVASRPRPRPADPNRVVNPPLAVAPHGEPPAAPAPLKIDQFDVQHSRGDPAEFIVPLESSTHLILEGDGIDVSARLNSPAYAYLIELNPDGKDQLCLPSDERDSPRQSAAIRFDESKYFPLTDGPGLQAFVVVASPRPLPPYAQWEGRDGLRQRWKHVAADDVHGVWRYADRKFTLIFSGTRALLKERSDVCPATFQEVCEYLENYPGVKAIRAIAFRVRPLKR